MHLSRILKGGAIMATLTALPAAAWADLTAAQVWQDWQDQARESQQSLTARVEPGPGRLTLTDVTMSGGAAGRESQVTLPLVTLIEEGGAVIVQMPDDQVLTLKKSGGEDPGTMRLDLSHPGLTLRAEGSPDDLTYRYAAPGLTLRWKDATAEGETPDPAGTELGLTVTASGVSGEQHRIRRGEARETTAAGRAASVVAAASLPAEQGPVPVRVEIDDLTSTQHLNYPVTQDMRAMLRAMEAESQVGHGRATVIVDMADGSAVRAEVANGTATYALGAGRLAGQGQYGAGRVALIPGGGAEPLGLSFDSSTLRTEGPVTRTDAAAPYALTVTLDNLEATAPLWDLIDEGAVLPRDPGQLTLALSGLMRWLVDPADLAEAPTGADEPLPFAVETLKVETLALSLAGARLTGTGNFTFAPGGPDGLPQPAGVADLMLTGGERLLDGLVQIGFVDPSQAMMAKMMVGAVATPGPEADTLSSHIELLPDGSVVANGRKLR